MLFSKTIANHALAEATVSRLKVEARTERTRASLFKIGGYSAFLVCLGLGCGMAFLGVSSIKKAQSSSDEISTLLATALSKTPITITGEVELQPGAIVSLERDSIVNLDLDASVRIDAAKAPEIQNTRPHLDPRVSGPQPKSGVSVATSFTVFQKVKHANGAVITSWTFGSSESATPTRQRCYYIERTDQAAATTVTELAVNGKTVTQLQRPQIDAVTAIAKCVWFSEQGGV